jgi:hypothetical protein
MLAMLSETLWRIVSKTSLPPRRRCLCLYSASPRSGCVQVQRRCSSSWGSIYVLWATTFEFSTANNETLHRSLSILAKLAAAVCRRLSEASLSQQRRCLCPSTASSRSRCSRRSSAFAFRLGGAFLFFAAGISTHMFIGVGSRPSPPPSPPHKFHCSRRCFISRLFECKHVAWKHGIALVLTRPKRPSLHWRVKFIQ